MTYLILLAVGILTITVVRHLFKRKMQERAYNKLIDRYGPEFGGEIANKRVVIGMTAEMVQASWGPPQMIDGKVIKKDLFKQNYHYGSYKYKRGNTHYRYRVTVENGVVTELREE